MYLQWALAQESFQFRITGLIPGLGLYKKVCDLGFRVLGVGFIKGSLRLFDEIIKGSSRSWACRGFRSGQQG